MTFEEHNPADLRNMEPPLNIPADPLAPRRVELMAQYRFTGEILPEFDALAQEIVAEFQLEPGRGMAWVNRLDGEREQRFVGVAKTPGPPGAEIAAELMREMSREQGACSTLITRRAVKGRTALVMNDLLDFPLFATNDMVTKVGARTYIAGQIIPPEKIAIGTAGWLDTEPRSWQRSEIDFINGKAERAMNILLERQRR